MFQLPSNVAAELVRVWEEEYKALHPFGRIVVVDDVPMPNITNRTCLRPNFEGQCVVNVKKLTRDRQGKLHWVPKSIWLRALPVRDNPEWGDRAEEGQPTIDFKESLAEETEILAAVDRLHKAGKHKEAFEFQSFFGHMMEDQGCTRLVKPGIKPKRDGEKGEPAVWWVCPWHTGWAQCKSILKSDLSDTDKAKALLWFYVRPNQYGHRLPMKHEGWAWRDIIEARGLIQAEVSYWTRIRGKSPQKAWAIAYARMHEKFPEYFEIRDAQSQVKLGPAILAGLKEDARFFLKANGYDVDKRESLNAYRHLIETQDLGGTKIFALNRLAKCPITLTVPDGKFACKIVMQTAVTDRLKEILAPDAWVRCGKVDMPAIEFNALSHEQRKAGLGCNCKKCLQEEIFFPRRDAKGLFFEVKAEVLLTEDQTELTVETLAELVALGHPGIPEEEIDWLHRSLRYLDPEQGEPQKVNPLDYDEWVYDDEDVLEYKLMSRDVRFNDAMAREDLARVSLNGPVYDHFEGDEDWAAWNRRAYFKWERDFRKELKRREERNQQAPSQIAPDRVIKRRVKFQGEDNPARIKYLMQYERERQQHLKWMKDSPVRLREKVEEAMADQDRKAWRDRVYQAHPQPDWKDKPSTHREKVIVPVSYRLVTPRDIEKAFPFTKPLKEMVSFK
jgi:hypothetical protein